jgi:tetraacyldisaccharide 4'-kinase
VIVVGNLTVGGTGKTPLVIWLCAQLRAWGFHPGVVARGYGGNSPDWPRAVSPQSDPREVGDEPVVIATATGCPVSVGPDRVLAARALLRNGSVNVIVSDDGLQHYRLARDIEICVVDAARRFGNGRCLPAGPLREPVSRLATVDMTIFNGEPQPNALHMQVHATNLRNLATGAQISLAALPHDQTVHAVAGIGNPGRFFDLLRNGGLTIIEHPFPDHHVFDAADLDFGDKQAPVLMTAKDAVKCRAFAQPWHWALDVTAQPEPAFVTRLHQLVKERLRG